MHPAPASRRIDPSIATSPTPLKRGTRVLVRAGNLLRAVNPWRRGQERVFAIPATVDVILGGGKYFLRSKLIPEGFTAHRDALEVVYADDWENHG